MSQPAIEGLLSETELIEEIHRYLDIKLDKETVSRPTKDVVVEVHNRFLDAIEIDWRRTNNSRYEPSLKSKMLSALKWVFKPYRVAYEINMLDLCLPTKKRTITFFNVALYVLAEFEALKQTYQEFQLQHAERQQQLDKVDIEIAKKRVAVDELALRLGQSKTVDQLDDEIQILQRVFDEKEDESNKLKEKAAEIKAYNFEKTQRIQALRDRLQEINQKIDQFAQMEALKLRESHLKEKLSIIMRSHEEFKRQAEIETTHRQSNIQRKENEIKDFVQASRAKFEVIKEEIKDINRQRDELALKHKEQSEMVEENVARANKMLQTFLDNSASIAAESDRAKARLASYKSRLNQIKGENETLKNVTFIKSTTVGN